MRRGFLLLLSGVLTLSTSAALVGPDGRAYAKIVIATNAPDSVRLAARELGTFLSRRCSVDLPIVHSAAADEPVVQLGGVPEAAGLPSDGFIVRTEPRRLLIAGRDGIGRPTQFEGRNPFRDVELYNAKMKIAALQDQGTLCGVYAFLEDWCGIRFYWPGEDGTVVPDPGTLRLPEIDIRRSPRFDYRYPWFCNFSADVDNSLWFRRVGFGGHAPVVIIDSFFLANHFKTEHPEFFALVDGKRDFTNKCAIQGGGHLCLNAKGLVKAWADQIRAFFDSHPDMEVYPVTPGDGLTRICECQDCQAELRPELGDDGKFSYHVWKFVCAMAREVAKTHPNRFIGCLAYESYWLPPAGLEFPSNVAVMVCQSRRSMANESKRKKFWKVAADWSKLAGRVYVWNWYLTNWPPTDRLPVFYPETIARDIARMAANPKIRGEFIESENFPAMFPFGRDRMGTPGMSHLNLYLTAKLYWNPDVDVRAVLAEYYRLFYGPAEAEMRAFWEEASRATESAIAADAKAAPDTMFPRKTLLSLSRHVERARKSVPENSAFARRIALIAAEYGVGAGRLTRMRETGVPVLESKPVQGPDDVGRLRPMRFRTPDAEPGDPPTWVFCGHDRRNAYFRFLCYEPRMATLQTKSAGHDDREMWRDDCLELFFCPEAGNADHGRQIIVNAAGAVLDGEINVSGAFDTEWESGAQVNVRREATRWTADVTIPLAEIGVADVNFAGDIPVNFYRMRNTENADEMFVWSPTGKPRHFEPAGFGRLRFGRNGAVAGDRTDALRMDRSKLLIGTYCLAPHERDEAHVRDLRDCGIDFLYGIPANDRATLDLFAKYGIGVIATGAVPFWHGMDGSQAGQMAEKQPLEKFEARLERVWH